MVWGVKTSLSIDSVPDPFPEQALIISISGVGGKAVWPYETKSDVLAMCREL